MHPFKVWPASGTRGRSGSPSCTCFSNSFGLKHVHLLSQWHPWMWREHVHGPSATEQSPPRPHLWGAGGATGKCLESESEVAQSCPALCSPMYNSLPSASVQGISRASILEWVAISLSRGSSWPRDQTSASCFDRWVLYHWDTREALGLFLVFT